MDYHQNARLTIPSREQLARKVLYEGCTLKLAAASFSVSAKTAAKWVRRYRDLGREGLADRSSRPHRLYRPTPPELVPSIEALRRARWTGARIAAHSHISRSTVSRILTRLRLNKIRMLEPAPVYPRYEHPRPGDLLHLDIKKLGRIRKPGHRVTGNPAHRHGGLGWEYLHVAIDDHSRIAFSEIHPNEQHSSVVAFLRAALAYYAQLGIPIRAILTDNGPAYHSRALAAFCRSCGIKHRFTRPYTPRTNGKAERFIQTALREWSYASTYQNSEERQRRLAPWIHQYNWHRPHASLGLAPPISRSTLDRNNLLTLHT